MQRLALSPFWPCALLVAGVAVAAPPTPISITCPAELPRSIVRTEKSVDGWIVHQPAPLLLNSAAPARGAPEEEADLASFTTVKTAEARIDTYPLPLPHPGGIWMKCAYGSLNELTLHRQLDDRIRQCRITTSLARPTVIGIVCS